jgi:hypothetical protein
MAGEQIPEAWIGAQVTLEHWTGNGRSSIRCSLETVNVWGIVVATGVPGDEGKRARFYPWGAVLHITKA